MIWYWWQKRMLVLVAAMLPLGLGTVHVRQVGHERYEKQQWRVLTNASINALEQSTARLQSCTSLLEETTP